MRIQIVDPVIVVYGFFTVWAFDQNIFGSESVFNYKKRQRIQVVKLCKRIPQSFWVNLPAPIACLKIRIDKSLAQVSSGTLSLIVSAFADTGVIAEGDKINSVF